MNNNKIAILITSHNRKFSTIKCIKHILRQRRIPLRNISIYLTIDGSTDGTESEIRSRFPAIRLLKGNGALFWNRGMHSTWAAARKQNFDYYMWLNDDTYLFPYAISDLLHDAEYLDNRAIVCGTTLTSYNSRTISYGGYNKQNDIIEPNRAPLECNHFNGNCVLIPKFVFQTIGNLDPIFRHSLGDFDYGLRARKNNIRSYVCSRISGVCFPHNKPPSWLNTKRNAFQRLSDLYSPLGCNPIEHFVYDYRHFSISTAVFHAVTIHLRAIFPDSFIQRQGRNIFKRATNSCESTPFNKPSKPHSQHYSIR